MKKHFVIFFSPGTFVAERTIKPIESWDVEAAVEMSHSIKERHSATPYGFCFITKERKNDELDSSETERSGMYYLGGDVLTLAEVREQYPHERILIENMRCSGWDKVVMNRNSWAWTQPLREGDIVLDFEAAEAEGEQA